MIERFCKKCGANVTRISFYNYALKDEKGVYCSCHCFTHRNDEKPATKKKVKAVAMLSMNGTPLKVFTSATDAAENTGFDASKIRDACRLQKAYNGYLWNYID